MTEQNKCEGGGRTPASMFRPVNVLDEPEGRLARRGSMAFVGVALQGAVRFLSTFLVGRLTNPASLAVVSSGMALANILSLAWPTSTGGAASRFVARARGEGSQGDPSAVANFLGKRTLQAVGILSVLALPAWVLLGGEWAEAPIIALLVAGYSGYAFTRGVHFGAGQASRQVKWDLLTSTLGVSGVFCVVLFGAPSILVLLVLAIAYVVYTFACWPWTAAGTVSRALGREIDAFVAWGTLGTLASAGFVQFAMVVAVIVAGRPDAGQFAAAMALAAPAAMVANSLAMVLFPSMAEALGRGDQKSLENQLDKSSRLLSVMVVCIFGVLVISARPVVSIVWGSDYAEAASLFPLLLVPGMLRSVAAPSQGAVSTSSSKGVIYSSLVSVLGLLVGILMWLVMPREWGVFGVGLGYAVGTSLIAVSLFVKAWHDHHQAWFGLAGKLITATLVMVLASVALSRVGAPIGYDILAGLVFVAAWLALVREDARELWGVVSRRSST